MSDETSDVRVWDPLVRVGHVLLIAGFAAAYLSDGKPLWLHSWAGYIVGAVVALRVAWGFVGPRHARFADFVGSPVLGSPARAVRYLADLVRLRAPRRLGHSPAGGLMVLALLAGLAITSLTGTAYLAMSRDQGPLAPLLGPTALAGAPDGGRVIELTGEARREARRRSRWLKEVHELAANFTLALIVLHVGGVALATIAHRENLVRAMVTGRKRRESVP